MTGDESWYQETVVKKIYIEEIDDSSLSPLIVSRPLNKDPGLCPIGVGKVLR